MREPTSLKSIAKEKARSTFFKINQARRREDQGPKPQGPLGHLGTEYLALPDDRRRPARMRTVGDVGVQLELRVVIPAAEVRHERPVGVPVELECRHVRVR